MNIISSKKYLGKVSPGDYFALSIVGGGKLLGRVVHHEPPKGAFFGGYLIYIYNQYINDSIEFPPHGPDMLLIQPLFVNKLGWTKGFFEPMGHRAIQKKDLLSHHCFSGCYFSPTGCINERGIPIPCKEPCYQYTLSNYKMVDYRISKALGLNMSSAGVE